nr:hypothetical protein GCM10020185_15760 [Pseudomonas brassicacearum subsp. brassicacearum]
MQLFVGEAAFRQLVLLNVVLIPLSFFLNVSRVEQALLIAVCLLALIVELLNSAVEAAIDRISLELHPLSKKRQGHGQRRPVRRPDDDRVGVGRGAVVTAQAMVGSTISSLRWAPAVKARHSSRNSRMAEV